MRSALSPAEQLEALKADPTAIGRMDAPCPEAQLVALTARIGLYWEIKKPCEAAAIEYLKRRPYDIGRFTKISDETKAKVLIAKPDLIHAWMKQRLISSPVEPEGFRSAVMRELLSMIGRRFAFRKAQKTILDMRAIGYQWPEFDVMEKSIRAALSEEEKRNKTSGGE